MPGQRARREPETIAWESVRAAGTRESVDGFVGHFVCHQCKDVASATGLPLRGGGMNRLVIVGATTGSPSAIRVMASIGTATSELSA